MEPFSFTRMIDRASPLLFENCANSISFASATLVKRKVTGQTLALQAFLRMDFKDVLIVGISWDDGDILKEKCNSFAAASPCNIAAKLRTERWPRRPRQNGNRRWRYGPRRHDEAGGKREQTWRWQVRAKS